MLAFISLLFVCTLFLSHTIAGWEQGLSVPLSQWRDGPYATFGYLHFALLSLCMLLMLLLILPQRKRWESLATGFMVAMFLIVLVTPSQQVFHRYTSYVLFASLLGYYSLMTWRLHSRWFIAYLACLLVLTLATSWHSYGLWQKSLVLFMLLLMNLHAFWLKRNRQLHQS